MNENVEPSSIQPVAAEIPAVDTGEDAEIGPAEAGEPGSDLAQLPDDALLVHIGVHKTGTTALQSDLRRWRPKLSRHGLTFPVTTLSQHLAGRALVGGELGWEATRTPAQRRKDWKEFATEVSAHPGRVLLSSEFFCQCNDAQAERLVNDLGRDRVRILVAFRPMMTLLPSSWQQYLKSGKALTYDEWLETALADPHERSATPTFWKRNDVAAQLGRWTALLGADRVTSVVIESGADMKIRRSIESMMALPLGLLTPPEDAKRSNRSLTLAEAEMVRQVNLYARDALPAADYLALVRFGAIRTMVESRFPEPEEGRLGMPEWAVPRVKEIGAAQAAALRASGVRIVGNPDVLAECSASVSEDDGSQLPTEAATLALVGILKRVTARAEEEAEKSLAVATAKPAKKPARSKVRSRLGAVARRLHLR